MAILLHQELTQKVISIYYEVYNQLGHGFLEKVYHNAMLIELQQSGFYVESQARINVMYKGFLIGEYFADIIVNDILILELKAVSAIHVQHAAQLTNYLRATTVEVGILFNFGLKPEFKRIVFTNDRKTFNKVV